MYREEDHLDQELVSRQDWEQSRLADNGEALWTFSSIAVERMDVVCASERFCIPRRWR